MNEGFLIQVALTTITIIAIIVIASVRVGALWLRLALIDVLAAMLVRRVDTIGLFFGVDLITDLVSNLVVFLAILTVVFAFIAAWLRRSYLMRAERERQYDLQTRHNKTIDTLENMRAEDEKGCGYDWRHIPIVYQVGKHQAR